MAIYEHKSVSEDLKATLVDVYLPVRDELLKRAYAIEREIQSLPKEKRQYFTLKLPGRSRQTDDNLFTYIALNARGLYFRSLPSSNMNYRYNEAWFLNPAKWSKGYELKGGGDLSKRRLLVTLNENFKFGEQAKEIVVDKSGLEIIADEQYKNLDTFKKEADKLLYEISLPYIAPNVVAENLLVQKGYDPIPMGL